MTLDRNRFLLLAAAIGSASCTTTSENAEAGAPDASSTTPDSSVADTSTTHDATAEASGDDAAAEASAEAGACDDDTGDGGASKYCPISEVPPGCLTDSDCNVTVLKAESQLRYFDCLANTPVASCFSETGPDAHETCALAMAAKACPDPAATPACTQIVALCADAGTAITQADCVKVVSPLNAAGRTDFVACVSELGCSDANISSCTGYLP